LTTIEQELEIAEAAVKRGLADGTIIESTVEVPNYIDTKIEQSVIVEKKVEIPKIVEKIVKKEIPVVKIVEVFKPVLKEKIV